MEFLFLIPMFLAVAWGCWYAKQKIDALTFAEQNPLRLLASYTTKVGYIKPSNPDREKWAISAYVYTDGRIKFSGKHSQTFMEEKCTEFQKFIIPLSEGVILKGSDLDKAKTAGVIFY